jgi:AraC family transcriptional regulator
MHPLQAEKQTMNSHPDPAPKVANQQLSLSSQAAFLLEEVHRDMVRNPQLAQIAALRLASLLTLPTHDQTAARGGLAPWQMRKIDRYLRENIARQLYLDNLAQHISLSISHFSRAFKESFGTTPHSYIIRLRLKLAQKLMLTTNDPLCQIALDCGLADQAHLSKLFKREIGQTPGAWRRKNFFEEQVGSRLRDPCNN